MVFLFTSEKKCLDIISAIRSENKYAYLSDYDEKYKKEDGFFIESVHAEYRVYIINDANQKVPVFDIDEQQIAVTTNDAEGNVDKLSEFIFNHKYVIPIVIIVFGFFLLFFGGVKWELLLGITGFVVGVLVVLAFFFVFVDFVYSTTSYVVIGILALVIGGLLSYLTSNSAVISYIVIGFPSGYFLSAILITLIQIHLEEVS